MFVLGDIMGCYTVPAAAALIQFVFRRKNKFLGEQARYLNQLYTGGALFGIIDHIWNGDLFLFSVSDFLLGITITLGMTFTWWISTKIASQKSSARL